MIDVHLTYELQDNKGEKIKHYFKGIGMLAAPTAELTFSDGDFTFTTNRSVIYDINTQTYYLRFVEYVKTLEDEREFDHMFNKLCWETNS